MFQILTSVGVSIIPVFVFLIALIVLDSFKLVPIRSILIAIVLGCVVAGISYFLNTLLIERLELDLVIYSRYGAPAIEEMLKAIYIIILIRSKQIGFMVDAAIYGFAVGAGFSFIENIYYLQTLKDASIVVWIIRGFGTAVMHGGTTAIFAVIAKDFCDRHDSTSLRWFLPGLGAAIVIHSIFNHFILPPLWMTLIILTTLPFTLAVIYHESEKATRNWLGVGFDTDMDLLQMILAGNIKHTKIGTYLQTLQSRFRGEVVADILCYLRIYLELSIRAKSILMMREAGLPPPSDTSDIKEKFAEMKYLEKSIGRTGSLALHPFIHTSSRNLWQLNMLEKK
ncbi:MAG TPA: PrsW family glutamic-type intramembrane protease [Bacteroidota bacterium]|nr:PrsW family glutamic-type intramembrane protease [Bacteroidota bacterium]